MVVQVGRPGDAREPPHQQRNGDAVGAVPGEADREESENEWTSRAPEPEILVKHVQNSHRQSRQKFVQCARRYN